MSNDEHTGPRRVTARRALLLTAALGSLLGFVACAGVLGDPPGVGPASRDGSSANGVPTPAPAPDGGEAVAQDAGRGGAADAGHDTGGEDGGAAVDPGPATGGLRIGYSADGNIHDYDDWHASPMALLLIAYAGEDARLVHFDYNNNLAGNVESQAAGHRERVLGAASRLGIDADLLFDDQEDVDGAVASIAAAVNASTADDPFVLLCAGPMEVCWRGIDAADDDRERYVRVVSHSTWNDGFSEGAAVHTWEDIQDFDVVADHIRDQNLHALRRKPEGWTWLRELEDGDWFYDAIATDEKAGDASDAGMMFYVLTGNDRPAPEDVKGFFGITTE